MPAPDRAWLCHRMAVDDLDPDDTLGKRLEALRPRLPPRPRQFQQSGPAWWARGFGLGPREPPPQELFHCQVGFHDSFQFMAAHLPVSRCRLISRVAWRTQALMVCSVRS